MHKPPISHGSALRFTAFQSSPGRAGVAVDGPPQVTCAVFPPGLVRASRGFSPAQCAVDIRPIETSIHSLAPVEAFHTRRGFFCAAMTARQGVMLYEIDPRDHNHRRALLQPTAQVAFEHDLPVPISWPDLPSEIDRRNGWRDLPDVEQEVRTRAFGDAGVALRKIIGWLMQSKDAHAVGVKVIALAAAVATPVAAGEREWSAAGYRRWLETGAIEVFGIDPARVEGVTGQLGKAVQSLRQGHAVHGPTGPARDPAGPRAAERAIAIEHQDGLARREFRMGFIAGSTVDQYSPPSGVGTPPPFGGVTAFKSSGYGISGNGAVDAVP
mgnify:CR=1 FL=1